MAFCLWAGCGVAVLRSFSVCCIFVFFFGCFGLLVLLWCVWFVGAEEAAKLTVGARRMGVSVLVE